MGVTSSQLKNLIREQGFRCAYTGIPLEPSNASADHKTPYCQGGENEIGNITITCRRVNSSKHTLSHEEFIGMCLLVAEMTMSQSDSDVESMKDAFIRRASQG